MFIMIIYGHDGRQSKKIGCLDDGADDEDDAKIFASNANR
jgi:hypothetical protein